ncbi:ST13 [Symbiodinium sp. CCMP2456]|nr:ST13 [Symbiodinium sp. CCMP2456]
MRALVASGTESTVAPPLAEHLPSPRWTAGTRGVVGSHRSSVYRSGSRGPEFFPISEESQCCPEEESGVSSASRRDPDLNMYDLNINPDLSQSDFSERDVNNRLQKGASKCSTPSKRSENRFDPARARKLAKAAMTLRESPLESEIPNIGVGGALEQPGAELRNLADNLADILPMRRSSLTSRHNTVIPNLQAGRKTVQVLPNSVSGAWRRQAKVLAAQMREEMAEEVKMAKNNMSFRGGLWWLRQLARCISLIAVTLTLAAFSFSFYWEGSDVFIARNLLDAAVVASALPRIQYMQELCAEDVSFEGMAQEWNTIQIFVRTLCDGCSYSLALQVGMIPVMAASTIFRILWSDSNLVDMLFSLLPFLATSLMPFHALVTAASTTQQCEQSPQVANSMLVSEWDNSMSQDLLAFMSRCDIGFFINDLRVTPAAVMKSTYVLVGVLVTIEVKPDDLDDTERLPKESEAWPQLFPPANTSAQVRHDAEKAAAVAMQAGDFTGAINVYTEAMRSGGSNPQMLCTRSALLLKMKRPCAAIRDCTAALKINNHMVKAYRLRGMAHRRLGHWKKAYRDLTEAQHLKFDPDTSDMHKLVAGKLGVTPTGPKGREDSPKKRSKAREA